MKEAEEAVSLKLKATVKKNKEAKEVELSG